MVALWALGGFYLSLGPSLAASIVDSRNLLWGGAVIVLLAGVGSLSSLLFRNSEPANAQLWGALALLAGVGITVGGIEAPSAVLLLVGTALAGVGFGLAFLGGFRILSALAPPAERARMVATIYVVCYLSFSLPAIVAGVVVTHSSLHAASLGYAAFVGALSAVAAAGALAQRTSHKRHAARLGVHNLPPTPCAAPMTEISVVDRGVPVSASSASSRGWLVAQSVRAGQTRFGRTCARRGSSAASACSSFSGRLPGTSPTTGSGRVTRSSRISLRASSLSR